MKRSRRPAPAAPQRTGKNAADDSSDEGGMTEKTSISAQTIAGSKAATAVVGSISKKLKLERAMDAGSKGLFADEEELDEKRPLPSVIASMAPCKTLPLPTNEALAGEYANTISASSSERRMRSRTEGKGTRATKRRIFTQLFAPGDTTPLMTAALAMEDASQHSTVITLPGPGVPPGRVPPMVRLDLSKPPPAVADLRPLMLYYPLFEPTEPRTVEQLLEELRNYIVAQMDALYQDAAQVERVPYVGMPEECKEYVDRLHQPPYREKIASAVLKRELSAPDIPCISRAYLARYYRQANPHDNERPCCNTTQCKSLHIPNHPSNSQITPASEKSGASPVTSERKQHVPVSHHNSGLGLGGSRHIDAYTDLRLAINASTLTQRSSLPSSGHYPSVSSLVICREFLHPDQELALSHTGGVLPETVGPCLVCIIFHTTSLYFNYLRKNVRVNGDASLPDAVVPDCLQSFSVRVSQPGEYRPEALLPIMANGRHMGIVAPFPKFQVNWFRWEFDPPTRIYSVVEQNMDFR